MEPTDPVAEINAAFAEAMKRARALRGLTQAELAGLLQARGLPARQSMIAKIENHQRPASLAEAKIIADVLGLDLHELSDKEVEQRELAEVAAVRRMLDRQEQRIRDFQEHGIKISKAGGRKAR